MVKSLARSGQHFSKSLYDYRIIIHNAEKIVGKKQLGKKNFSVQNYKFCLLSDSNNSNFNRNHRLQSDAVNNKCAQARRRTAHLSSTHLYILHSDSPRRLYGLDFCNYAPPPTILIKITTHRVSSLQTILLTCMPNEYVC